MFHLNDFCHWLNNDVGGNGPLPNLLHNDYGAALSDSLKKHFAETRPKGGLRMSNIGKPATILALAKLGYVEPEPRGKSRVIFHLGDVFENLLEVLMQSYGIEVLESQTELKHFGLTGHLDYVIKSPVTGEPVIVEAKTMSPNYTRIFKRDQNNDRGYITQLAMYSAARKLPATWICFDKGTAETFEVQTNPGTLQAALEKAEDVIARLDNVQSLEDILHTSGGYFRAPPPIPEKYRGKMTGNHLVPVQLKMSPFRYALYNIVSGINGYNKPTEYVDGNKTYVEMCNVLDGLVEKGEVIYDG
jgi:hypothetical protein